MARVANRFQRGSGVFQCGVCKRSTRDTGGDNTQARCCAECYEMAGIENSFSDGYAEANLIPEYERLAKLVVERGGQISEAEVNGNLKYFREQVAEAAK